MSSFGSGSQRPPPANPAAARRLQSGGDGEFSLVPLRAEHLQGLRLQPQHQWFERWLTDPAIVQVMLAGKAWAGLHSGKVVAAGGYVSTAPGIAAAWATFADGIPKTAWPRIVACCRAKLDLAGGDTLEAIVPDIFPPGRRLARLLDFVRIGTEHGFDKYVRPPLSLIPPAALRAPAHVNGAAA